MKLGKRFYAVNVNDVHARFECARNANALPIVLLDLLLGIELIRRRFGHFQHKIISFFGDSSDEA